LLDSLAAVTAFTGARRVLDVGAGGGLPGMILAIWAAEAQPEMQISMIDTVHKKTAFLTQVKAELQLSNVTVYTARVEQLQLQQLPKQQAFDVITSRAFAELNDFINWTQHLLAQGGHYIAMKGLVPGEEIKRLPEGWKVREIRPLTVPQLQVERHLIFMEKMA
jgi:16S rRNA (guanine527-N7)-methyltransferase